MLLGVLSASQGYKDVIRIKWDNVYESYFVRETKTYNSIYDHSPDFTDEQMRNLEPQWVHNHPRAQISALISSANHHEDAFTYFFPLYAECPSLKGHKDDKDVSENQKGRSKATFC